MNTEKELEISKIIQIFNMEEVQEFIQEQIVSNEYNDPNNHFHQIYLAYRQLETKSLDDETRRIVRGKFEEICFYIIRAISNKFNLSISENYIENNIGNIGGITLSLYVFFVIDLKANLIKVLENHLRANKETLAETFESMKGKKDSTTLTIKKAISDPELALIVANIYDIGEYSMDFITTEGFFHYLDTDYLPVEIIKKLYEEDVISGDFVEPIAAMFKNNIELKNAVCFDIMYRYTNPNGRD